MNWFPAELGSAVPSNSRLFGFQQTSLKQREVEIDLLERTAQRDKTNQALTAETFVCRIHFHLLVPESNHSAFLCDEVRLSRKESVGLQMNE